MHLLLRGSPLTELNVTKSDGTLMFLVETHPYLEDRRTEVYDATGDVLGSILWNGTQPSHICVYSESAMPAQAFEMVPRGDPTAGDNFEVVAGDGAHEMLWIVDQRGLQAHYPMTSRGSSKVPPLVAQYYPRRPEYRAGPSKRKLSEIDCDTIELDVDRLSDDALGRFWVAFVLLDIIRKSKYRIQDEITARLQTTSLVGSPRMNRSGPATAVDPRFGKKGPTGWRVRAGTEKLKDLAIGLVLQPRRWSL